MSIDATHQVLEAVLRQCLRLHAGKKVATYVGQLLHVCAALATELQMGRDADRFGQLQVGRREIGEES